MDDGGRPRAEGPISLGRKRTRVDTAGHHVCRAGQAISEVSHIPSSKTASFLGGAPPGRQLGQHPARGSGWRWRGAHAVRRRLPWGTGAARSREKDLSRTFDAGFHPGSSWSVRDPLSPPAVPLPPAPTLPSAFGSCIAFLRAVDRALDDSQSIAHVRSRLLGGGRSL